MHPPIRPTRPMRRPRRRREQPRIGQVLALAPCDVRDRTQHDDGRNRQFDGKRRQAKRAARGARGRSQRPVQKLRIGTGGRRKRAQCDLERRFEPLRCRGSDRLGGERGQGVTYQFDGLANDVGEPAGEARMLKGLDGPAQGFAVLDGEFGGFLQRQISTGSIGFRGRTNRRWRGSRSSGSHRHECPCVSRIAKVARSFPSG